jgi:hypothetical protein
MPITVGRCRKKSVTVVKEVALTLKLGLTVRLVLKVNCERNHGVVVVQDFTYIIAAF